MTAMVLMLTAAVPSNRDSCRRAVGKAGRGDDCSCSVNGCILCTPCLGHKELAITHARCIIAHCAAAIPSCAVEVSKTKQGAIVQDCGEVQTVETALHLDVL